MTNRPKNRYFTPLTFNLVAVVWILGFLPLAVAFVSNVGADSGEIEEYQRMTVEDTCLYWVDCEVFGTPAPSLNPQGLALGGDTLSWYENGGSDLSYFYESNNPDLKDWNLDCSFIQDGFCKGTIEPSLSDLQNDSRGPFEGDCDTRVLSALGNVLSVENNLLHNCDFAEVNSDYFVLSTLVNWDLTYDGSYFYRGTDSHGYTFQGSDTSNITDSSYSGDSGNTFSFRLNAHMMNQLEQGEMVDALRFTVFDWPEADGANPNDYNCAHDSAHNVWRNFTVKTTLTQQFEDKENVIGGYEIETDNKFFMEAQPFFFTTGCYVGYEIVLDFNGFDTRDMFNFVDGGKWNESALIVEWEFEREDGLPLGSTNVGINGIDDFAIAIDFSIIEAQQVEFITNVGLLTMGSANIVLAAASTPYWDPFKNFFKGRL